MILPGERERDMWDGESKTRIGRIIRRGLAI